MRNLDVLEETVVRLDELRKRIDDAPTAKALRRWTEEGLVIRDGIHAGKRATLEFCNRGSSRVTSLEAYFRFLATINGKPSRLTDRLFGEEGGDGCPSP